MYSPSQRAADVYQAAIQIQEQLPVADDAVHSFDYKLKEFDVPQDKIHFSANDYPYFRSSLVDEAIERENIRWLGEMDDKLHIDELR